MFPEATSCDACIDLPWQCPKTNSGTREVFCVASCRRRAQPPADSRWTSSTREAFPLGSHPFGGSPPLNQIVPISFFFSVGNFSDFFSPTQPPTKRTTALLLFGHHTYTSPLFGHHNISAGGALWSPPFLRVLTSPPAWHFRNAHHASLSLLSLANLSGRVGFAARLSRKRVRSRTNLSVLLSRSATYLHGE